MEQVKSAQNRSSLLNYAISRLTPEVFSHPVWVRFGKKLDSASPNLVDDLFSAAKHLQKDEPGIACQILLICAVYQTVAGQWFNAMRTSQQALTLSQSNELAKETIWALWGLCAISIQQGNFDQACCHLIELQAILQEQDEWILADFVDVFRQSVSQAHEVRIPQSFQDSTLDDTLHFTFDWLIHWGLSLQGFDAQIEGNPGLPVNPVEKRTELTHSFFSIQRLEGRWHTLMLAIRSELSLQWRRNNSPPAKGGYPLWGPILNSIRFFLAGRSMDHQLENNLPHISNPTLLPPENENIPPEVETHQNVADTEASNTSKTHSHEKTSTSIPMTVHMLGTFSITVGDLTVKLPASRGTSIFKYLLLHHHQYTSREVLMDIFWPDIEPEMARNNLNVAIYSLRKALRTAIFFPVIHFENGGYGFEPGLQIWLDIEEFERCTKAGQMLETRNQLTSAIREYEAAASLYQGDFLEQDPYEEWTILDRERLRIAYLDTLDSLSQIYFDQERYAACITTCQMILTRDRCREDAHCLSMRCYSRQGQYPLALRQYQICIEALRTELDVEPARETKQLYERIRRREPV